MPGGHIPISRRHRTVSYSLYARNSLGRRVRNQFRSRLPKTAVLVSVAALTFLIFSPSTKTEAHVSKPNKQTIIHLETVSALNKRGVMQPPENTPKVITTASVTHAASASGSTAGKPSWVNYPLYVDPTNEAAAYVASNPSVKGASYISRMAKTPVAQWFGDWNQDVQSDVNSYVSAAAAVNSVPQLAIYNIPNRDCGGYSVGGANSITTYTQWVQRVAAGIGNRRAVIILEPDALGALDCLPSSEQNDRTQSIAQAVTILKKNPLTAVYIDAGTPVWQPADVMATRLKAANVASADGFSINVSYFASTAQNQAYGNKLSALIGNKHYVIDTSRNGGNHAVIGMQCNPSFASFGNTPTTNTGSPLNDALLWVKIPWESDGPCNGSPGPGQPYWDYAIQLAQNANW